jgi:hypothetical protein
MLSKKGQILNNLKLCEICMQFFYHVDINYANKYLIVLFK